MPQCPKYKFVMGQKCYHDCKNCKDCGDHPVTLGDNKTCASGCGTKMYVYNHRCFETCAETEEAPYSHYKSDNFFCYSTCPDDAPVVSPDDVCVNKCPKEAKWKHLGRCSAECPEGNFKYKDWCVKSC